MKPLLDGDILLYEIGHSGEFKDDNGDKVINSFDRVAELLDKKIDLICEEVGATEKPTIYITGDQKLVEGLARRPLDGVISPTEYTPNFRMAVGTTKGYKATRKSSKPFHFYNLRAYMLATYDCVVSSGWEADDQMAMDQTIDDFLTTPTIICSRDKDLRMVPGWHYSWECGKQRSMGPTFAEGIGSLFLRNDDKVIGYGPLFFYYQMIVGDTVDNIPGLKGWGTKKAMMALDGPFSTEREIYECVRDLYKDVIGDGWQTYFREQAYLLWMVQELDDEGNLVMWRPPK